uniref:Uncharacterized protein n=1 Tax=Chromera velia CCMP2878 TaxID=1169474 RepID=A0A0G4I2M1_9ALVE|eukprot:Cvel_10454.t1-p1 / transcript=Cvel_10454.t1 / gene=Cvel_10454 / organism=Chromera_velia_CCMP2878 / gene_product=hypothetical protein / transcript_product=hypothetical protein / location=Cvel_scaffold629:64164-70582(+) / protein_length=781 / sequence_SO=supercontig / SO=protein_coding / is_pseudo=false
MMEGGEMEGRADIITSLSEEAVLCVLKHAKPSSQTVSEMLTWDRDFFGLAWLAMSFMKKEELRGLHFRSIDLSGCSLLHKKIFFLLDFLPLSTEEIKFGRSVVKGAALPLLCSFLEKFQGQGGEGGGAEETKDSSGRIIRLKGLGFAETALNPPDSLTIFSVMPPNLKSLSLRGNRLGLSEVRSLSDLVRGGKLSSVESLDLSNTGMTAGGLEILGGAFLEVKPLKIESLKLKGAELGNGKGVCGVVGKECLPSLKVLQLARCTMCASGAKRLAVSIYRGEVASVEEIDLEDFEILSDPDETAEGGEPVGEGGGEGVQSGSNESAAVAPAAAAAAAAPVGGNGGDGAAGGEGQQGNETLVELVEDLPAVQIFGLPSALVLLIEMVKLGGLRTWIRLGRGFNAGRWVAAAGLGGALMCGPSVPRLKVLNVKGTMDIITAKILGLPPEDASFLEGLGGGPQSKMEKPPQLEKVLLSMRDANERETSALGKSEEKFMSTLSLETVGEAALAFLSEFIDTDRAPKWDFVDLHLRQSSNMSVDVEELNSRVLKKFVEAIEGGRLAGCLWKLTLFPPHPTRMVDLFGPLSRVSFPSLTDLTLCGCLRALSHWQLLAAGVREGKFPLLKSLNVRSSFWGREGMEVLFGSAVVQTDLPFLENLKLMNTSCGEGMGAFGAALKMKRLRALTRIDLEMSRLGGEGIKALGEAVRDCRGTLRNLFWLNITGNPQVELDDLQAFLASLPVDGLPRLKSIDMRRGAVNSQQGREAFRKAKNEEGKLKALRFFSF